MPDHLAVDAAHLRAALRDLPPDQGELYRLCAGEGLDLAEAARRLGLTAKAAEALLATALVTLDARLRPSVRSR